MSEVRFGWYVGAADVSTASVRLRCLTPMTELRMQGRQVSLWKRGAAQPFDVLIFSKIYDDRAYQTAREIRARGTRVILDLCDNHWFGEDRYPAVKARAEKLERMLGIADLVTSSTPFLAEQIADRFNQAKPPICLVPDPVLPPASLKPTLRGRWELAQLRQYLGRHAGASHLVWFGNQGAGHVRSGMEDLDRIRSVIDVADGRFTLTVVSNSKTKFRHLFSDWRLPLRYLPWRLDTVDHVLDLHDAAVIPITCNAFTMAKSINRPATALMAGLEVFADRIPSYDELAPFITLDNWERLGEATPHRDAADIRNRAAQDYLRTHYSAERVAMRWSEAVDQVLV